MKIDDYTNKEKLQEFRSEIIAELDQIDCALLIAQCFFRRLIPIDGVSSLLLKLWRKLSSRHRAHMIQAFYNYLKARPDKTKTMTTRMLEHMVNGKSLNNAKAAGGWNRAEFGEFLVFLDQSRR